MCLRCPARPERTKAGSVRGCFLVLVAAGPFAQHRPYGSAQKSARGFLVLSGPQPGSCSHTTRTTGLLPLPTEKGAKAAKDVSTWSSALPNNQGLGSLPGHVHSGTVVGSGPSSPCWPFCELMLQSTLLHSVPGSVCTLLLRQPQTAPHQPHWSGGPAKHYWLCTRDRPGTRRG